MHRAGQRSFVSEAVSITDIEQGPDAREVLVALLQFVFCLLSAQRAFDERHVRLPVDQVQDPTEAPAS